MFMEDGHSDNGNHRIEFRTFNQMKTNLAKWNRYYRGECFSVESSIGGLFTSFAESNLYVRWQRKLSGLHNLDPFEWNLIGLLYRQRTSDEINAASRKKRCTMTAHGPWEDGDFPLEDHPTDLAFEFVAVYASLMSLITGVKAWGCRKITGRVQLCPDNMYDPIKGVKNMYWFNVGFMDAKNIHFPWTNALQLGRKIRVLKQLGLSPIMPTSTCVITYTKLSRATKNKTESTWTCT